MGFGIASDFAPLQPLARLGRALAPLQPVARLGWASAQLEALPSLQLLTPLAWALTRLYRLLLLLCVLADELPEALPPLLSFPPRMLLSLIQGSQQQLQ